MRKLAPDSILNKKIKEIMCYTGEHRTYPFEDTSKLQGRGGNKNGGQIELFFPLKRLWNSFLFI